MRPLIALLLALVVPAAALAQPLRVGVEGAYPPFSEIGTDGKLKGFDLDIAGEICTRLKRPCEFVQAEFDAMIPGLRAKKFDAIVASMSITAERKKSVDFSDKYYQTPARFIVRADAAFEVTPQGLAGKTIGVQRATIHEKFAKATFPKSRIVGYAKQDEVWLDMISGRLDGGVADAVAADLGFLKTAQGKGFAFKGPVWTDPAFFGEGAGIAVRKGDDALRKSINDAIAGMRADGTYQRLQSRYFAYDIYGAEPKSAPKK